MRHLSNCAAGSVVDGKSGELRDIRANVHRTLKDKRKEKKGGDGEWYSTNLSTEMDKMVMLHDA